MMQRLWITVFACAVTVAFASGERRSGSFLHFEARPVSTQFSLAQAQRLADEQRRAKYGDCGMSVFKEKKGAVWIFATKVGYAGVAAPDICVVEPPSSPPTFSERQKG